MKPNKARFEKLTVMNLSYCPDCGGDWFHAIIIKRDSEEEKGWQCDNCGMMFNRKTEIQKVVITEKLEYMEM